MQSEIHTFPHLVLQPWQQTQPTQESRARRMGALGNLCMVRETRIPMFSLHSAGSRIPKVCGPCTSPLVTPLHYNHHVAFSNKSTSLHVALVLGCDATRNVLWTISSQHNGTSGCNQSLKPKTKKVARWPCWSLGRPAVGQGSPMWQGHISSLSPNGLLYSESSLHWLPPPDHDKLERLSFQLHILVGRST